ncbi:hypothetical protein Pelo_1696 [Pelomyxa schiedti]|nr:hypothetical protein Pelo_1696 [Pelomyxa schiedti]
MQRTFFVEEVLFTTTSDREVGPLYSGNTLRLEPDAQVPNLNNPDVCPTGRLYMGAYYVIFATDETVTESAAVPGDLTARPGRVKFFLKLLSEGEITAYKTLSFTKAAKHISPCVVVGKFCNGQDRHKAILVQDVGDSHLNKIHVVDPQCTARVIRAVWTINCSGVIILDLKPQHIIVPPDPTSPVKIVDFDLAEIRSNTTAAGTATAAETTTAAETVTATTTAASMGPFTIDMFDYSMAFRGNALWASIFQHLGLLTMANRILGLLRKLKLLQNLQSMDHEHTWLDKAKLLCEAHCQEVSSPLVEIICPKDEVLDPTISTASTAAPVAAQTAAHCEGGNTDRIPSPGQREILPYHPNVEKTIKPSPASGSSPVPVPASPVSSKASGDTTQLFSHKRGNTGKKKLGESLFVENLVRGWLSDRCGLELQNFQDLSREIDCLGTFKSSKQASTFLHQCQTQYSLHMFLPNDPESKDLLCGTDFLPSHVSDNTGGTKHDQLICEVAYIPESFTREKAKELLRRKFFQLQSNMLRNMAIFPPKSPLCLAFVLMKTEKPCSVMAAMGRFFFSVSDELVPSRSLTSHQKVADILLKDKLDNVLAMRAEVLQEESSRRLEISQGQEKDLAASREVIADKIRALKKELKDTLTKLQTEHNQLIAKHESLTITLNALTTTHSTLLTDHNKLIAKHERLTTTLNALTATRSTLLTDHNQLIVKHESLTTTLNALTTTHSTLLTDHNKLIVKQENLTTANNTLQTEHNRLETAHNHLQLEHQELQKAHKEQKKALKEVKAAKRCIDIAVVVIAVIVAWYLFIRH